MRRQRRAGQQKRIAPRLALYHRVSTLDQHVESARAELRATVRRLGGRVVLDIEETGSGANNDRPGLDELLRAARAGKLDRVLVWKLDRFGRSSLDCLANLRALERAGVGFSAITQGIELNNSDADAVTKLQITMLAACAEFERELIRERTRLGLSRARAAGTRLGRPRTWRPPASKVKALRAKWYTWQDVANELGCTVHAARTATAKNGAPNAPKKSRKKSRSGTTRRKR